MGVAWLQLQIITNFQLPFEPTPSCSYTAIKKQTSELSNQLFPRCISPLEKVIVPELTTLHLLRNPKIHYHDQNGEHWYVS